MSRQPNNNVKNRGVVPGVPGTSGPSLPTQDLPSPNCEFCVNQWQCQFSCLQSYIQIQVIYDDKMCIALIKPHWLTGRKTPIYFLTYILIEWFIIIVEFCCHCCFSRQQGNFPFMTWFCSCILNLLPRRPPQRPLTNQVVRTLVSGLFDGLPRAHQSESLFSSPSMRLDDGFSV